VVLGVATFGVALWRDLPADELGWRVDGAAAAFAWAAAVAAGGLLLVCLSARVARLAGLEESPVSLALMPRTGREVRGFLLLAGAGAVAEEYLFRGYLQHVLAAWLGSPWIALAACSLSFGVSHGYQRAAGMARATLLGGLLTLPVVWTGSLFPAIVAHFWINAAVGTGGWRLLYPEEAEGRSAEGTGAGGAGHRAEGDGER
jgi:membrane protease YdiL (CAAX protease family)